ncbi:MAG: hypothetical protein SFT90_07200 [Rickettsiales bacterium]|nr:hypothetical protein [Rickettsiales bacterium]
MEETSHNVWRDEKLHQFTLTYNKKAGFISLIHTCDNTTWKYTNLNKNGVHKYSYTTSKDGKKSVIYNDNISTEKFLSELFAIRESNSAEDINFLNKINKSLGLKPLEKSKNTSKEEDKTPNINSIDKKGNLHEFNKVYDKQGKFLYLEDKTENKIFRYSYNKNSDRFERVEIINGKPNKNKIDTFTLDGLKTELSFIKFVDGKTNVLAEKFFNDVINEFKKQYDLDNPKPAKPKQRDYKSGADIIEINDETSQLAFNEAVIGFINAEQMLNNSLDSEDLSQNLFNRNCSRTRLS